MKMVIAIISGTLVVINFVIIMSLMIVAKRADGRMRRISGDYFIHEKEV